MNNVKSAIRSIIKHKLYSMINIMGLTIGLTCSIILFLYVGFENSFDKFHKDKDRIFRLSQINTTPDAKETTPMLRIPVGPDIKDAFPEVESMVRMRYGGAKDVEVNNHKTSLGGYLYADDNFFEFFSFELIQGHPKQVLKNPNGIVLTKSLADKLFGNSPSLGKTMKINDIEYVVTGLAADIPKNSHIQFSAILPIEPYISAPDVYTSWDGGVSATTFLKLSGGSAKTIVEKKLEPFLWDKINKEDENSGYYTEMFLEPMSLIHTHSNVDYDMFKEKKAKNVMTLFLIGCLVFLTAFINYISIANGILSQRLKEFKIKNFLGIGKKGIAGLIFSESFALILTTGIFSILLILILKPFVTNFFGVDYIQFQLIKSLHLIVLFLLGLSIFSGTVLFFSNIKIVNDRRTYISTAPRFRNKKLSYITALQFCISIILISSLITVYKQLDYALHKDLGFKKDNIVFIMSDKIAQKSQTLVNEIRKIPGVENAATSFGLPGMESTANGYRPEGTDQWYIFNAMYVDDHFLNTYNIELKQGRTFSPGDDNNVQSFLVNETLVKKMNWDNPIGKKLYRNGDHEVIGVVKDFHLATLHQKIPPMIISKQWQNYFYMLSISLNTSNTKEVLGQIENVWNETMPGSSFNYNFLNESYGKLYSSVVQTSQILLTFSIISIFISILGLFGITMLMLNGKVKEIGVRKVNGAKEWEVLAMLNKKTALWIILAFLIGCPAAWYIMKLWLEGFAYSISLSWWIFAIAGFVTFLVTILTVSFQSWKAARRNPVEALRYE